MKPGAGEPDLLSSRSFGGKDRAMIRNLRRWFLSLQTLSKCTKCGSAVVASPWFWDTRTRRRGNVYCDECRREFDALAVLLPEAHDDTETPEIW